MTFLSDLRYSARSLSRSPALAAALLCTVALGVGSYATIAGFSTGLQQELSALTNPDGQFKLQRLRTLLSWTTALVFLTATANVAGLLLSRSARRAHETAARAALGATDRRLAGHIVADSVVVAVGGGLLGALVAYWTASAFPALLYSEDAERLRGSGEVWLVARAIAAYGLTMMICALGPIAQLRHQGPMNVLRRSSDGGGNAVGRLRSAVVAAQIATCVLLVIGSAVLLQGFRSAVRTLRAERIGQPVIALLEARAGFGRPDLGREYFAAAERRVRRVAGVTGVLWTSALPGARTIGTDVRLEQPATGHREVVLDTVTSNGAEVLAQSVTTGRLFGGVDTAGSCPAAIANESATREFFGGDALGRSIEDGAGRRIDIVGVVTPQVELRPKSEEDEHRRAPEPTLYFYERQTPSWASESVTARRFRVPILPDAPPTTRADLAVTIVSAGYLPAMGGSLVAGTEFGGPVADQCGVALVNREAADAYFGGKPIDGAVIDRDGWRARIVGIAESPVLRVVERRAEPMIYFSSAQFYAPSMTLIALAAPAPELVAAIDAELQQVDGAAKAPQVMTLEERLMRTALGPERIATALVAVCALLAFALGIIGVYGVMADAVRARQRDIALRLALGAPASHIVYGVFRDGLRLAAVGAALGMTIAWVLLRLLLYADDGFAQPAAWIWAACPAVLLVMVAIATVAPARWALAVNPLTISRDS
jgi:hypothetical protein